MWNSCFLKHLQHICALWNGKIFAFYSTSSLCSIPIFPATQFLELANPYWCHMSWTDSHDQVPQHVRPSQACCAVAQFIALWLNTFGHIRIRWTLNTANIGEGGQEEKPKPPDEGALVSGSWRRPPQLISKTSAVVCPPSSSPNLLARWLLLFFSLEHISASDPLLPPLTCCFCSLMLPSTAVPLLLQRTVVPNLLWTQTVAAPLPLWTSVCCCFSDSE